MCGIAGIVNIEGGGIKKDMLESMTRVLRHRGPDDAGLYLDRNVGLGHRRLSIIDLSPAGHQPMSYADGRYWISYNGEVYNYRDLRAELEGKGYKFRSQTDTEVILAAYAEWGEKCLQKFNGMWAFLIYDIHQRKIFGARDRFGVKPLYWYRSGPYVFFASEIKAILSTGLYQAAVNQKVVARFLVRQHLDIDNESFYTGIAQIPAGYAFELNLDGMLRQWSYWSIHDVPSQGVDSPTKTFYQLFEDAVRIRMRSDVPLGVSLSGGLDSTSILCTMAELNQLDGDRPGTVLQAFSYMPEEFDESSYIRDTLRQTGAQLNRLFVDPMDLIKKLDEVLWYHDEPVHTMAALIQFELMRLIASAGIKVILNGQGADETIGGYHDYFFNYWYSLLRARGIHEVRREIEVYCQVHGGDPKPLFARLLLQFGKSLFRHYPLYRTIANQRRLRREGNDSWFTPELTMQLDEDMIATDPGLDAALRLSVERFALPLYLRIEDRNSMAHGIEVRLPFMDYRLVSMLFNLPPEWKMRGPWNKFILREAMAKRIPDSVKSRTDKMGFALPWTKWIATLLYDPIKDVLASREARERGIYNLDVIQRDLDLHRNGKTDVTWKMFNVFQYELWSRMGRTTQGNAPLAHVYNARASVAIEKR